MNFMQMLIEAGTVADRLSVDPLVFRVEAKTHHVELSARSGAFRYTLQVRYSDLDCAVTNLLADGLLELNRTLRAAAVAS